MNPKTGVPMQLVRGLSGHRNDLTKTRRLNPECGYEILHFMGSNTFGCGELKLHGRYASEERFRAAVRRKVEKLKKRKPGF